MYEGKENAGKEKWKARKCSWAQVAGGTSTYKTRNVLYSLSLISEANVATNVGGNPDAFLRW